MSATMQNRQRNRKGPHMYNRGNYQNNNYGRRETPEPEPQNNNSVKGVYQDPRTTLVMCSILGTQTQVKTRNGNVYKGCTSGFSEKGDIAIVDAKLDDENSAQDPTLPGIIIPKDAIVVCKTFGVDMKGLCSNDFTDSGIASRINGSTDSPLRELQPWMDDDVPDNGLALEDQSGGWEPSEMFKVNKDKFNVKSSYSEDLHEYTTKLPTPDSEGYEERLRLAKRHADEIERSDGYQHRISKELDDGDEESKFSSVHRGGESNHRSLDSSSSGKNTNSMANNKQTKSNKNGYTIPALRGESEPNLRNGNPPRNQGRGPQRQNSPYSSANHGQQQQQHPMHQMNARHMNNHYHQGPPPPQGPSGPMNRNQGPPMPQRQSPQNHSPTSHSQHQYNQHPSHGMQSSHQHQSNRPPPHHQQMAPPTNQPPKNQHPHPHLPGSIPQHPSQQQQQPMAHQMPHVPSQKPATQHHQIHQQNINLKHAPPNVNGGPNSQASNMRQHIPQPVNGDGQPMSPDVSSHSHKAPHLDVSSNPTPSQAYHHRPDSQQSHQQHQPQQPRISSPPQKNMESPVVPVPVTEQQVISQNAVPVAATATSPPSSDRRTSRGESTTSDESRNKVNQQLQDFHQNFVLESQGPSSTSDVRSDSHQSQPEVLSASSLPTAPTMSGITSLSSTSSIIDQTSSSVDATDSSQKSDADKPEEDLAKASKLNPNAKEFKPFVPKPAPAPSPAPVVEAQSPSPQPRVSPHYIPQVPTPFYPHSYVPVGIPQALMPLSRKKATVSVGPQVVNDPLTAHQVTGQPLMATQQAVIFQQLPGPGAGYQVINVGNPPTRMIAPNSLAMGQGGQHTNIEQHGSQNQPQPVFMTPQQQVMGAIPAHLPPHPQPAHGQPHPHSHPTSTQQQNVHPQHPNPSPSPVQQHNAQPLPHHMSQGPPQSVTPQPSHYSQMNALTQHNMQTMPRTSMANQQTSGHPSVSIAYPINMSAPQYSYPNASGAHYSYAHQPQPQTSQNSNHGPGPQPQYVVMPQPGPQTHPPMQQHNSQPYAATGIQFQAQPNIMQGPPQMPPNHGHNPGQGGPHLIHSGMQGMPAGMHPQVSGTPPGMFMPVPQQFQHQQ